MLAAGPILCALLAAFQAPTGMLGDDFAGSRVRGPDFAQEATSGLEGQVSAGTRWTSRFTYGETASGPSRQYNGRVFDPGTGFHDYGARMYWPQIGRFISADSVMGAPASPASLNRYSYVHNNPCSNTDPTGHFCIPCIGAAVGAVGGGIGMGIASWNHGARGMDLAADILFGIGAGGLAGATLGMGVEAVAVLAAGGGAAASQMEAAAPEGEAAMTTLYRGVMPAELQSIEKTGQFINTGSAEGKYFSTTAQGVASYAKQAVTAFKDPPYTMVSTQIPTSAITPSMQASVDGGIPAVVVPNAVLPTLTPAVQSTMPIPGR